MPSQVSDTQRVESDMIVRAAPMQPSGLDEKTRSISCVLSTETPVRMYDWSNGGYVDEVLRADGGQIADQLPLLDNHSRYSSLDVVGSAREIKAMSGQLTGRVYFAESIDRAEQVYQLVRQGHLTDVSVGYRYGKGDFIDIPSGQTAKIGKQTYTAGERTLRVVTSWHAKELSVTPIGADQLAKMRSLSDCKFRHGGNISEINDSSLAIPEPINDVRQEEPKMSAFAVATETKTEAEKPAEEKTEQARTEKTGANDSEANRIREEAVRAERERIEYARSFSGIRTELVEEAIKDGWSREKINERFLQAFTERKEGVPMNKAPAGHVVDNEIRKEDIQAIFLQRAGVNFESGRMTAPCFESTFERGDYHERDMTWAIRAAKTLERKGALDPKADKALNFGHRYRSITMVQACAMSLDWANIRYDRYDEREIVTRAMSSMQTAALMSNALGAMILDAFVGTDDTTDWVDETDVPNNLPQPVAKAGLVSRLRKRTSGQIPVPVTRDSTEEFISAATFSEQVFIDRIDLLADRFGTIGNTPREIGIAAREVRPDLVYSALIANANMADGNALFSTAHGNVAINAALGPETLAARKIAMANQVNNGRLIGARPGTLLVSESRSHYADELLGSSEKRDNTASTVYGTKNWAQGKYQLRSEPRLDVGCVNPMTEVFVAGRPNDYYLIDAMKRWGYLVAYIRSSGRGPIFEPFMPGDGRIGIGATIELDIGLKAVAWEGLQCGTGAGSR